MQDTYLAHYGLKGMKWGTRRWQYDDGRFNEAGYERYFGGHKRRSSKHDVKAAKKKYVASVRKLGTASLGKDAKSFNTALDQAKSSEKAYRTSKAEYESTKYANIISAYKSDMEKKYADNPEQLKKFRSMSDDEIRESAIAHDKLKKAAITAGVLVGTAAVAYAGYKLYELNGVKTGRLDPVTKLPLLKNALNPSEILENVNPYGPNSLDMTNNVAIIAGSQSNCMLCTTSYDLMKKGYDVKAGMSLIGWMPDDLFPKIYKNYEGTIRLGQEDFFRKVMKYDGNVPDSRAIYESVVDRIKEISEPGANGNIVVWWKSDGGHSMIWENIDGKIVFKDGQTNAVYKNFEEQILRNVSWYNGVEILRTDNLEINPSGIKKYMLSSDPESALFKAKGTYQAVSQLGKQTAKAVIKEYPSVPVIFAASAGSKIALDQELKKGVTNVKYRTN